MDVMQQLVWVQQKHMDIDIVAQQKDSTGHAWLVGRNGSLDDNAVSNDTSRGVRPVITVLSANLY